MKQSRNFQSARSRRTARTLAVMLFLPAIFLLAASVALAANNRPVVHYVNFKAAGANDGTNWTDAFTDDSGIMRELISSINQ